MEPIQNDRGNVFNVPKNPSFGSEPSGGGGAADEDFDSRSVDEAAAAMTGAV
jgi:hypothetical protein